MFTTNFYFQLNRVSTFHWLIRLSLKQFSLVIGNTYSTDDNKIQGIGNLQSKNTNNTGKINMKNGKG